MSRHARIRRWWSRHAAGLVALAGLLMVSAGLSMIWGPLGLIALGAGLWYDAVFGVGESE